MEGRRWPQSFPGWGPQEEAQRTGQRETAAQGPGVRGFQNQNRAGGWQVLGEAGLWPEGGASGSPRSIPGKPLRLKTLLGPNHVWGRGKRRWSGGNYGLRHRGRRPAQPPARPGLQGPTCVLPKGLPEWGSQSELDPASSGPCRKGVTSPAPHACAPSIRRHRARTPTSCWPPPPRPSASRSRSAAGRAPAPSRPAPCGRPPAPTRTAS